MSMLRASGVLGPSSMDLQSLPCQPAMLESLQIQLFSVSPVLLVVLLFTTADLTTFCTGSGAVVHYQVNEQHVLGCGGIVSTS